MENAKNFARLIGYNIDDPKFYSPAIAIMLWAIFQLGWLIYNISLVDGAWWTWVQSQRYFVGIVFQVLLLVYMAVGKSFEFRLGVLATALLVFFVPMLLSTDQIVDLSWDIVKDSLSQSFLWAMGSIVASTVGVFIAKWPKPAF